MLYKYFVKIHLHVPIWPLSSEKMHCNRQNCILGAWTVFPFRCSDLHWHYQTQSSLRMLRVDISLSALAFPRCSFLNTVMNYNHCISNSAGSTYISLCQSQNRLNTYDVGPTLDQHRANVLCLLVELHQNNSMHSLRKWQCGRIPHGYPIIGIFHLPKDDNLTTSKNTELIIFFKSFEAGSCFNDQFTPIAPAQCACSFICHVTYTCNHFLILPALSYQALSYSRDSCRNSWANSSTNVSHKILAPIKLS